MNSPNYDSQTQSEINREALESLRGAISMVETPEDVFEVAVVALESDSYSASLMERIESARKNGNTETEERLIRERRGILDDFQIMIALETGVEIDALEHEKQRKEYRQKIEDIVSSIDSSSTDEEIMVELGILTPAKDAEAEYRFAFPSRIFPPYVVEQWNTYIKMVEQSETAGAQAVNGIISQADFSGTDLARGKAHNTVSESVGEILQFPEWGLEDNRRLVSKMRDAEFAKRMGELRRYGAAIRKQFYNDPEQQQLFGEDDIVHINRAIIRHGESSKV